MTTLLILLILLNEASVCLTHIYAAAGHDHWSHRPWRGIHLFNWFHVFSALRWPLLISICLHVWKADWIYYVSAAIMSQTLWWILKGLAGKKWPSKLSQLWKATSND